MFDFSHANVKPTYKRHYRWLIKQTTWSQPELRYSRIYTNLAPGPRGVSSLFCDLPQTHVHSQAQQVLRMNSSLVMKTIKVQSYYIRQIAHFFVSLPLDTVMYLHSTTRYGQRLKVILNRQYTFQVAHEALIPINSMPRQRKHCDKRNTYIITHETHK